MADAVSLVALSCYHYYASSAERVLPHRDITIFVTQRTRDRGVGLISLPVQQLMVRREISQSYTVGVKFVPRAVDMPDEPI